MRVILLLRLSANRLVIVYLTQDSGVAWKSLPLLNGGSVAIMLTDSEFIPRRNGRLSP